jgi:hypothetical protein
MPKIVDRRITSTSGRAARRASGMGRTSSSPSMPIRHPTATGRWRTWSRWGAATRPITADSPTMAIGRPSTPAAIGFQPSRNPTWAHRNRGTPRCPGYPPSASRARCPLRVNPGPRHRRNHTPHTAISSSSPPIRALPAAGRLNRRTRIRIRTAARKPGAAASSITCRPSPSVASGADTAFPSAVGSLGFTSDTARAPHSCRRSSNLHRIKHRAIKAACELWRAPG